MDKKAIPDTIGVSMDTRESLRKASQVLTTIEIPGYDLIKEIGRGNFGTVWQAERKKTGQKVAIKIVDNETDINWTYFRRELEFLRELEEHPNTLTILDAQLEQDPPYIVMPLADGGSLEQSVREQPPDLKTVEDWLWQLAEAMVFIHRKGVIHCDFKPSNVLLSSERHVRIADLGQARRAGHGVALGTIGFMAPEQCSEKASPSVSWDVYGFGATAYWLLTGKIPRASDNAPTTLAEYAESLNSQPLTPIRKLNPKVDKDLARLVEWCLVLDPEKRAPSLDAVLADMHRRSKNEPMHCWRPWNLGYLLKVALRRRTVQAFLVATLAALVVGLYFWNERNYNRYLTFLSNGIRAHESGRLEEAYLNWLEALRYRPSDPTIPSRFEFMPLARVFPHEARATDLTLTDGGETLISSAANGEVILWNTETGQVEATHPHPNHVAEVAVSPDGKRLATASWDGAARLFDMKSGELTAELVHQSGELRSSVNNLIFSKDGRFLTTADLDGRLKIWLTESGQERAIKGLPEAKAVQQILASHPNRPILAALTDFTEIGMWDLDSGEPLPFHFEHSAEINDLEFTADGEYLVSASDDGVVSVWSLKDGKKLQDFLNDSRVNRILTLSSGRVLAGCEDGTVSVWEVGRELPVHQFFHRRPVVSLELNHDSTLLAVGTGEREDLWSDIEANGTVRVWELEHGYQVGGAWSHDGPVDALAFHPKLNIVYSASGNARQTTAAHLGAIRAWRYILPERVGDSDMKAPKEPVNEVKLPNGVRITHGENVPINSYTLSPDGAIVATASKDRTVRFWSYLDGSEVKAPLLLDGYARVAVFSPEGEEIATAAWVPDSHSVVQIWEVETVYPVTPALSCPGEITKLEYSPDGRTVTANSTQGVFRWTLRDGKNVASWEESLHRRLRLRLDKRGSVVPIKTVSNGHD